MILVTRGGGDGGMADRLQPPVRVAGLDAYVPQNIELEPLLTPDADTVVQAVRRTIARNPA